MKFNLLSIDTHSMKIKLNIFFTILLIACSVNSSKVRAQSLPDDVRVSEPIQTYLVTSKSTTQDLKEISEQLKSWYKIDANFSKIQQTQNTITSLQLILYNDHQKIAHYLSNEEGIRSFEISVFQGPSSKWFFEIDDVPQATTDQKDTVLQPVKDTKNYFQEFGKSMGEAGKEMGAFGKSFGQDVNSNSKEVFRTFKRDFNQAKNDLKTWWNKDKETNPVSDDSEPKMEQERVDPQEITKKPTIDK